MEWSLRRCVRGAAAIVVLRPFLAASCIVALAGGVPNGEPGFSAAEPRGASVAFESIDGLPSAQFHQFVQDINQEADTRRLAIVVREQPSAYRVRGYLSATVEKGRTTVSWVWDVFNRDWQRALRINGAQTTKGRGWQSVDDAMLKQIAESSMNQLTAFLTSSAAEPQKPAAGPAQVAFLDDKDSTPEAAGIFPIFKPDADPLSTKDATSPTALAASPNTAIPATAAPLPRRRPPISVAVSANPTITMAAVGVPRR